MMKKIKNSPYQRARSFPQRLQVTARQLSGKWLQYALSFGHQSSLTCRGRIAFGAEPCSGAWRFLSTESSNLSRRGTVHCGAGGWPLLLMDQMARELPQPWARPAAGTGQDGVGGNTAASGINQILAGGNGHWVVCLGSCLPSDTRNSLTSPGC